VRKTIAHGISLKVVRRGRYRRARASYLTHIKDVRTRYGVGSGAALGFHGFGASQTHPQQNAQQRQTTGLQASALGVFAVALRVCGCCGDPKLEKPPRCLTQGL
jgi:hypothetical protein